MLADQRLDVALEEPRETVVIDYSSPNVAKEMHVGHLRSTVIGDAIARTLEFLGHTVIRANHIGDWGTQFGMLIANLERVQQELDLKNVTMELSDLGNFYRESRKLYDEDEAFAEQARSYVLKLQLGDKPCRELWKRLVDITMEKNQGIYDRLGISLTQNDIMGESTYNSMLSGIIDDLRERGLAREDDGAQVVFLEEFRSKQGKGKATGVIVQKRDGGFLYATTDIACLKYRYERLGASRILYFIDSRQHQHLAQVWAIARKAGYVPQDVLLEHHAFGMMLGKDGKPLKSRKGGAVRLAELLDEAEDRTSRLVKKRSRSLSTQEKNKITTTVAMAALKYADLSKHRATDYMFDWDSMLALEGNTAPYMQYAYTRIASIFSKANVSMDNISGDIQVKNPKERSLVIKLLQFEETIQSVSQKGLPHLMCSYLFDLAGRFSGFYEACPVLAATTDAMRKSRLRLSALTAKTLKQGLDLLGIKVLEKM